MLCLANYNRKPVATETGGCYNYPGRERKESMQKRTGKNRIYHIVKILVALILFAAVLALTGNFVVKKTAGSRIIREGLPEGTYDCIIVLGCGLKDDGTPKQMLRARLDCAIDLYENGVSHKLLMSGDHGTVSYDEVNAMKDYAMAKGVPSEDIFMDHAGFSTYETMYRAAEVFEVESACIVTQEYHLYRGIYDAEKMGIRSAGACAVQNHTLKQAYRNIREIIARNKDLLWCLVKPKPTYLGDKIPISGNGDVTNDR